VRINPATIEEQEVVPRSMRLSETDLESEQRDFSVEMETGTGKTYVYLRTILELYKTYKMTKFVIVVPNIAIREGVLKSLELMKDHFKELYPELRYDSYVYDSKSVNRVQQFATGIVPQILVMNIQAFARDELIINRPDFDKLRGHAPKEFIRAVKPVVIMDEPQKLEGPKQKAALESLNALFRLRYSATHKDHKCLVYRLGPVDAYQQKLVKQISVLSMTADEDLNIPYVEISSITPGQGVITATATINKTSGRKQVTLRLGSDLREESGLELYSGWIVEDIRASTEEDRKSVV
jgi:type III restriction enzyme